MYNPYLQKSLDYTDFLELQGLAFENDLDIEIWCAMRIFNCKKHQITLSMLKEAQLQLYENTPEENLPDHIVEMFKTLN